MSTTIRASMAPPWFVALAGRIRTPDDTGADGGRGLLTRLPLAWAAYRRWRRLRQDEVRLQNMDDRLLRDIGIWRSEIRHVVRYGREPG